MKHLILAALIVSSPGGDRERGLELYRQGRFPEAAAAFRAALASEGDSAELQYNLALASWRAGDLAGAESAAEKYAAGAADARPELHAGLLGAVRYDEAKALAAAADQAAAPGGNGVPPAASGPGGPTAPADPLPMLEQALAKAQQAKDHFVRGATKSASPELLRNTERAVGLCDELQKKIEDQKRQREEQKQDAPKPDENKPDQNKQDENKQDENKQDEKQDPEKQDEKKPDENRQEQKQPNESQQGDPKQSDEKQQGDETKASDPQERPEPKTEEPPAQSKQEAAAQDPKPDGKPGEEKPEPKPASDQAEQQPKDGATPAEPRHDAPGEAAEARELSPEQTQRLLEQLKELDGKMKALRAFGTTRRRSVERDW